MNINFYNKTSRSSKGQAEIIVVFAVAIVAIVAVLFATKTIDITPAAPSNIASLQGSLSGDIISVLSADASAVVKQVGDNGGYLDLTSLPDVVEKDGVKTAYWQFANQLLPRTRAQIASEISKGLKDKAKQITASQFSSVSGKNVQIASPTNVEATIRDGDILLRVTMAVSVEGYPISQPFEVVVPSKLGKSIDIASDIVTKNSKDRLFELFTANSIRAYGARDELGYPLVPSVVLEEGCGKGFTRRWENVKPEMETLLKGMLENVYTAGKVPSGIDNSSTYPVNVLPVLADSDVKFSLGVKELDQQSFQMYPNPFTVRTENILYLPTCVSQPKLASYVMFFPVIADIGSDDENSKLRFALHVYLKGYNPGNYNDLKVNLEYFKEDIAVCKQALCDGKVTVIDGNGPVKYAQVTYAGCYLGKTDSQGIVESKVPCGASTLEVREDNHDGYTEFTGSDDLADKVVTLLKIPFVKVNLYNIEFANNSGIFIVNGVKLNDKNTTLLLTGDNYHGLHESSTGSLSSGEILPGLKTYSVIVGDQGKLLGGHTGSINIPGKDIELWMYTPTLAGGITSASTDQNKQQADYYLALLKLANITISCGQKIGADLPISEKAVDIEKIKACQISSAGI